MIVYSLKQKIQIKVAMYLMPIITRIIISHSINTLLWKILGVKVGKNSLIRTGTEINAPFMLQIGNNSIIHGHLKTRGSVIIGDFVEFVENVTISTQSFDMHGEFQPSYKPVYVEDYCWLSINCIILQGVRLAKGTVVSAGAVVVKNTEENGIYGGIPAKQISTRANTYAKYYQKGIE